MIFCFLVILGVFDSTGALAQIPISPSCLGDNGNWDAHFLDGGKFCDVQGEEHGGTSGADGVDAMDFDGDCDLDIITGWEESGKVFIYLNPLFSAKPDAICPQRYYPDNTELRAGAIVEQWPLLEVTRGGNHDKPFAGVEDAIFADNNGDNVADYVVIATEDGRMDMFVSFPTPTGNGWEWHTFDLKDGDEYFMRAVVGNINDQGCPDILAGSKTVESLDPSIKNRTGDIRWWACPDGWTPELWKGGMPLPSYGDQSEENYFKDLWGHRNMLNTHIKWIMEMNIINLVHGANPNSNVDYPEILFTDRRTVGYMYLDNPALIADRDSWRYVNIDDPGGSDFRWYAVGQLVDSDGDHNFAVDDPDDPPEIVAAYNGDPERGVFARWYEKSGENWIAHEVVIAGGLPWGKDSTGDKVNKATGIADVDGDGYPEIIATIRGSNFSGTFFLKPQSGSVPPRCSPNGCSELQHWTIGRISPTYMDNIKFDNLALIDADLDCDVDIFSVEENGVSDKGLGVVWYENRLLQASANTLCSSPIFNHDPLIDLGQMMVTTDEGTEAHNRVTISDSDMGDELSLSTSIGTLEHQPDGAWLWRFTPVDGPASQLVALIAEDNRGGSSTSSFTLHVNNITPTITGIATDAPINEGGSLLVTVTANDPVGIHDPLTYEFDCDNDGVFEIGPLSTNMISCSFGDDGNYIVHVRVSDDDGGTAMSATTVTVNNVAPTVQQPLFNPASADVNQAITTVASFQDPAGELDQPYSCTVDYGNGPQPGMIDQETCRGPSQAYGAEGDYQVTVVVTDKDGDSSSAAGNVTVRNLPPVVNTPVTDPIPSDEGTPISINATFSDGGINGLYSCIFDYGDSSGNQPGVISETSCSGPMHIYDDNGTYGVIITVIDKDGATGSASGEHQVHNVAPTAVFAVMPAELFIGESATINFSNPFDPSNADSLAGFTYSYDCQNDGIWEGEAHLLNNFSCPFTYSGAMTLVGQIRDKDGGATTYTATVTVLTLQEALQNLITDLNPLLEAGIFNQGQANSLTSKLENAIASLERGNATPAINQVEAFQHEVVGYMNSEMLTSAQGQPLLDKAQRIRNAIQHAGG